MATYFLYHLVLPGNSKIGRLVKFGRLRNLEIRELFNTKCDKGVALTKLARWYDEVERLNCKFFNSVIQTMQNNYGTIVNYFENRSTNASAESFNAKVKAFRNQFRGVSDIPFFIYRLSTLFA